MTHAARFLVPAAWSIVLQMDAAVDLFSITIIDLTVATVRSQLRERDLDFRGIRAADSLHIVTALSANADVIVSTDDAILHLDAALRNASGKPVRCLDSDVTHGLL